MTFGSLFAGIGGFDLGFERAGLRCGWQVEINPFCRQVLAKHWPSVRRWDDVRTFPPEGDWRVDVICGGFPCQDISKAGNVQGSREGISGSRSGLWSEYERIIRVLRPKFVVVENTAKIVSRGLGRVLGGLAECRYDAEWVRIPAAALGACHIRDRLFVLAYANSERLWLRGRAANVGEARGAEAQAREREWIWADVRSMAESGKAQGRLIHQRLMRPDAVRTGDGFPGGMDRRRACGNAVYPAVAEWIGRRIVDSTTNQTLDSTTC